VHVFQGSARQSIRLRASQPCEEPVSRLGGAPNLPPDIEWPTSPSGSSLAFLAQLDLSAIPPIPGMDLPREGALFFFYDSVEQAWGFSPEHAGSWKVAFTAQSLNSIPLRPAPEGLEDDSRFAPLSLAASLEHTFPALDPATMEQLEISEDEFDGLLDLQEAEGTIHRIGGYPDEIQGDVALKAQLVSNGIDCGDGEGYEVGEARGLNAGAADWLLLLQLDSEDEAGMMWGDLGRLYFMIHKADLASRHFDKVWTILQCS
jgi:uncharacterized protein YwqG